MLSGETIYSIWQHVFDIQAVEGEFR